MTQRSVQGPGQRTCQNHSPLSSPVSSPLSSLPSLPASSPTSPRTVSALYTTSKDIRDTRPSQTLVPRRQFRRSLLKPLVHISGQTASTRHIPAALFNRYLRCTTKSYASDATVHTPTRASSCVSSAYPPLRVRRCGYTPPALILESRPPPAFQTNALALHTRWKSSATSSARPYGHPRPACSTVLLTRRQRILIILRTASVLDLYLLHSPWSRHSIKTSSAYPPPIRSTHPRQVFSAYSALMHSAQTSSGRVAGGYKPGWAGRQAGLGATVLGSASVLFVSPTDARCRFQTIALRRPLSWTDAVEYARCT